MLPLHVQKLCVIYALRTEGFAQAKKLTNLLLYSLRTVLNVLNLNATGVFLVPAFARLPDHSSHTNNSDLQIEARERLRV
mgnify:CR=1 FL=1